MSEFPVLPGILLKKDPGGFYEGKILAGMVKSDAGFKERDILEKEVL